MYPVDRPKSREPLLKVAFRQNRADLVVRDMTLINVDTGELMSNANISICAEQRIATNIAQPRESIRLS